MRTIGTICVAAIAMLALGCEPHELPDSMRDINYQVPRPSPDMPNCEYAQDNTAESVADRPKCSLVRRWIPPGPTDIPPRNDRPTVRYRPTPLRQPNPS